MKVKLFCLALISVFAVLFLAACAPDYGDTESEFYSENAQNIKK